MRFFMLSAKCFPVASTFLIPRNKVQGGSRMVSRLMASSASGGTADVGSSKLSFSGDDIDRNSGIKHGKLVFPFLSKAAQTSLENSDLEKTAIADAKHFDRYDGIIVNYKNMPKNDKDHINSARNFASILGASQEDILQHLWMSQHYGIGKSLCEEWKEIKSKSDLFIEGMGEFDAKKAYNSRVQRNAIERKDELLNYIADELESDLVLNEGKYLPSGSTKSMELAKKLTKDCPDSEIDNYIIHNFEFELNTRASIWYESPLRDYDDYRKKRGILKNDSWFVKTRDLQVEGYSRKSLDQMDEETASKMFRLIHNLLFDRNDSPLREHFIQHNADWLELQHLKRLPELYRMSYFNAHRDDIIWPMNWKSLSTEQLLSTIDTMQANKGRAGIIKNQGRKYSHLESLKDEGKLNVVRSDLDFAHASKKLNYWVGDYTDDIYKQKSILVTLCLGADPFVEYPHCRRKRSFTRDGQEIQVAWGVIKHNKGQVEPAWDRISLAYGEEAPEDVKKLFYGFTENVQQWAKDHYKP